MPADLLALFVHDAHCSALPIQTTWVTAQLSDGVFDQALTVFGAEYAVGENQQGTLISLGLIDYLTEWAPQAPVDNIFAPICFDTTSAPELFEAPEPSLTLLCGLGMLRALWMSRKGSAT